MIIIEAGEPFVIRPREGECFTIRKSIHGGYVIGIAWAGDGKLNGKIVIEHDVEPIIREEEK
jgi:hypothetical protein